jgi:hypothetical protein
MAAGLPAGDYPELPIPNDVFGYIVNFLGFPDLYRCADVFRANAVRFSLHFIFRIGFYV